MAQPILEMTGISKTFPGVTALADVDFRLFPGEVHAVMGENGAGKSTLIKVLTGVYLADAGRIVLDGRPVAFSGPLQAQQAGVSTLYQEINLCPNLSVAENIFIGREPRRAGMIHWSAMRRQAAELLARLDLDLDLDVGASLASYSLAVQQLVAIMRAVDLSTKVLILDEPTSSLDPREVEQLFTVMRRLKDDGVAILFVSHFVEQVYAISDRMTVLRNGRKVGEYRTSELGQRELVSLMLGGELGALEELEKRQQRRDSADDTPYLVASGVGRSGAIAPYDLSMRPGEVVGLAGLLGSGRTEAVRLLFGADRADSGTITVDGQPTTVRTPRSAIARHIAFLPENRKSEGLIAELSVRENIVLALQAARGWTRPLPPRRRDELVERYIDQLRITPSDPDTLVRNLSGGNQQKVLLARWLATDPTVLILDEPTRGIDVGAKAEIQRLVATLAEQGKAVLFISAELDEVLRLSDRIMVLRDRQMISELTNDADLSADDVMATIASGAPS